MDNPFTLTLFDKTLHRTGWLGDPTSVKVTPRHNGIGTLEVVVPMSHPKLPLLTARGSRITCDYHGEQVFSGPRRPLTGDILTSSGTATVSFEDDIRLLWRLLGYATPTSAAETQPDKEDRRTGPAETVVKAFVNANRSRDWPGRPLPVVVPSQGRGASVNIGLRMVPLADQLVAVLDTAGIGLQVRQGPTSLVVDCYQPSTFPRKLTEASGAVIGGSWSESPPTVTATIIGGPNEGTSRQFRRLADTARQDEWGDVIESLTDASQQVSNTDILAAGQATLDGGGPTAGFKLELAETKTFHYGGPGGVHVGDLVTARVLGQDRTDVLREATLSWDRDNGFKVTPTVGEHTDDPDRAVLGLVQSLARGIRALKNR